MIPGVITLERTWRDRYLRQPAPKLILDRSQQGMAASEPLPQAYQSHRIEQSIALSEIVGRYPLGPFLPRYQRALAAGIGEDDVPTLDWTPPPAHEAVPVLSLANRARHTNFSLDIADGADTPLVPADDWCTYLLIVNTGASDATLGLDKSAIGGLPLAAGGGFQEFAFGTKSAARVAGNGGATTIHVVHGRAHPAKACALPCEAVE